MPLTYGETRKYLAQFASKGGKCASDEQTKRFVKEVLQYMLYSGQYGNLRKFCFHAVDGCFTVPYELEVPLKVKVDGEVGNVWNKWFEWYNASPLEGCVPADNALFEEPNAFSTAFDLPSCGSKVGVIGTCQEGCDAHVIVQGIDKTGREIVTFHDGEQLKGEYLSIEKGKLKYSKSTFAKITSVQKSRTKGYAQLVWINTDSNKKGFLADYSPFDERPEYRRFRLTTRCKRICKVSILGRIRIKSEYADNDIIPFDNLYALQLAAQAINAQYNNNVEIAAAKDQTLQTIIQRENDYKRVQPGTPLDIAHVTSTGRIKNII